MSTGRHFQNGHHNTAQIQQYCGGHFENGDW
jgi:hypothetical protein